MLVGLDALACVPLLDAELLVHTVQDALVDGDRIDSDLNTFEVGLARHQLEPGMLPNLVDCVPLFRVGVEDTFEEVLRLVRDVVRCLEVGA